jgi:preprotein translocase subunit YajC
MKSILIILSNFYVFVFLTGCIPPTGQGSGSSQSPGGGMTSIIFMVMIIAVFWLFFIRPQAKKQKQQKKFIEDMQRGDKIVTIAGIHGTINKLNEDGTINLEVSPGSYIKVERSAVSMEWTNNLNKTGTAEKK